MSHRTFWDVARSSPSPHRMPFGLPSLLKVISMVPPSCPEMPAAIWLIRFCICLRNELDGFSMASWSCLTVAVIVGALVDSVTTLRSG